MEVIPKREFDDRGKRLRRQISLGALRRLRQARIEQLTDLIPAKAQEASNMPTGVLARVSKLLQVYFDFIESHATTFGSIVGIIIPVGLPVFVLLMAFGAPTKLSLVIGVALGLIGINILNIIVQLRPRLGSMFHCKPDFDNAFCTGCGYPVRTMTPEDDGCLVCPECGAAWRPRPEPRCPGCGEDLTWCGEPTAGSVVMCHACGVRCHLCVITESDSKSPVQT